MATTLALSRTSNGSTTAWDRQHLCNVEPSDNSCKNSRKLKDSKRCYSRQKRIFHIYLGREDSSLKNGLQNVEIGIQHKLKNTTITSMVRATLTSSTFTVLIGLPGRWKLLLRWPTVVAVDYNTGWNQPVPGSEIVRPAELRKREHENKTGGNWVNWGNCGIHFFKAPNSSC